VSGDPIGKELTGPKSIGATIRIEMAATNSRDRMIEALRELPPDATVDDAIEQLMFLAKIEAGLTELDRGEGIPHDEVKRRLGL
jgi:predicted transcriptional regulator